MNDLQEWQRKFPHYNDYIRYCRLWNLQLNCLSWALNSAAIEYARERHLLWILFGWPLDGK